METPYLYLYYQDLHADSSSEESQCGNWMVGANVGSTTGVLYTQTSANDLADLAEVSWKIYHTAENGFISDLPIYLSCYNFNFEIF